MDQGEVRITSAGGGQKGSKLCQPTLIPPAIRRKWLDQWSVHPRVIGAAGAVLRFEEGEHSSILLLAAAELTHFLSSQLGAVGAMRMQGDVYGFGARKYSRINYLKGYEWSLTQDAFWRHTILYAGEETCDLESGLHHIGHALWHVTTQIIFAERGIGTDDRIWKKGGEGYTGGAV